MSTTDVHNNNLFSNVQQSVGVVLPIKNIKIMIPYNAKFP